jgi:hypothetical protein
MSWSSIRIRTNFDDFFFDYYFIMIISLYQNFYPFMVEYRIANWYFEWIVYSIFKIIHDLNDKVNLVLST